MGQIPQMRAVISGTSEQCRPRRNASNRRGDRKSTRLNSSHRWISYAVFCLKKKKIGLGNTVANGDECMGSAEEEADGVAHLAVEFGTALHDFFFSDPGPPEIHSLPPQTDFFS